MVREIRMSKGKIEQNNLFIEKLRQEGHQHCFKSQLPFPKCVNRSIGCGPVLAVSGIKVIFKTLEK